MNTQGPWSNDHSNIVASDGQNICAVWTPPGLNICGNRPQPQDIEREANARLISAAPEILTALEAIQANPNDPSAHRIALDAIAKAKKGG